MFGSFTAKDTEACLWTDGLLDSQLAHSARRVKHKQWRGDHIPSRPCADWVVTGFDEWHLVKPQEKQCAQYAKLFCLQFRQEGEMTLSR